MPLLGNTLKSVDLVVLAAYLVAVVAFGCWFVRRSRTTGEFMAAGGRLPGWAVGLSIFGTFLSSNTFLGYPGKAYVGNWNPFVFSLAIPFAAILASRLFVPFYRRTGEVSAYHHLEVRFGLWARTYALVCYLLLQLARVGVILFGVSLALTELVGWPQPTIIVLAGTVITLYTLLGGIEAVIWTDVVQSIVLTVGAVVVLVSLCLGMPEGPGQIFEIASADDKFSLGSMDLDLTISGFWVVFLFGIFSNLNNFGIDQSFVQRYHTARTDAEASRSVWLATLLYVPVSAMFLFIGTALFAYYDTHPEIKSDLVAGTAAAQASDSGEAEAAPENATTPAATPEPTDYADKVFPHYMVQRLPPGVAGLLLAALVAAAMSSIDTSLNSSATVLLSDIYKRYINPDIDEKSSMRVLYLATALVGAAGTAAALAMLGIKSILDQWWKLSSLFSTGMLGLFLLGLISRRAGKRAALAGVLTCVPVLTWMARSNRWKIPEWAVSHLHENMYLVVGTIVIVAVGTAVATSRLTNSKDKQ